MGLFLGLCKLKWSESVTGSKNLADLFLDRGGFVDEVVHSLVDLGV